MAGPWERFKDDTGQAPTAPVTGPWSRFADDVTPPAPPPAAEPAPLPAAPEGSVPMPDPVFNLGANQAQQSRNDQVLGRAVLKGASSGFFGLPAIAADAGRNAAYGVKSLAAKTGLVEAPDPKNYYGGPDSYFPTVSALSENTDQTLDKLGFAKPTTSGERMLSAGVEGVAGGVGGVGLGQVVASGGSALARRVGGFLATQPEVQAAAGAAGGLASQGIMERGPGNETAAMAAGLVAGVGTGMAGAKLAQPRRVPVPTLEQLEDAKTAAYQRVDDADLRLQPRAVQRLEQGLRSDLPNEGIFVQHEPKARNAFAGVERMVTPDAMGNRAPVRLTEVDRVRRNVGRLGQSPEPTDRRTAAVFSEHIDDFSNNLDPVRDVVSGDPRAVGFLNEARAANRQYAKASALELALDKGYLRAKSTGVGQNVENAQRQNIRRIFEDPNSRAYRQFDEPERQAMRDFVEGSTPENLIRWGSRFAPTNLFGLVASGGDPRRAFGALSIAGLAAKGAGNYLHGRKVRNLEDLIRGGPGAVRPPPRIPSNSARGAAQGFLGATRAEDDEEKALRLQVSPSRYR